MAALAAVLVLSIPALLLGCQPRSEEPPSGVRASSPASSPAAASTTSSPGLTPVPDGGPSPIIIEEFDDPDVFGGPDLEVLRHPVSAGDGFAILGEVTDDDRATHAEVWLSPDGVTWERIRRIPAMDGGRVVGVAEMAEGTLVAIGSRVGDPIVWTSDDRGRSWTEAPASIGPTGTDLRLIVAGPLGVLAVGTGTSMPQEGHAPRGGGNRLWLSSDGRDWRDVPMPVDVFGEVDIYDVAATSSGFVAVGGRFPVEPAPAGDPLRGVRAAAWLSADGLTWTSAEVQDGPPLLKVYAGSEGVLAVGFGEEITGTTPWQSADGRSWQRQNRKFETGNSYPAAWDGRIFMLRSRNDAGQVILELSESRDGIEWRVAGETPSVRVGGIGVTAPGVPGLVQVGGGNGDVVVWLIRWPAG